MSLFSDSSVTDVQAEYGYSVLNVTVKSGVQSSGLVSACLGPCNRRYRLLPAFYGCKHES